MMFYVAAQFTAAGKALQQAFGASYGITHSQGVLIGGFGSLWQQLEQVPARTEALLTKVEGRGAEQTGLEEEEIHLPGGVTLRREPAGEGGVALTCGVRWPAC